MVNVHKKIFYFLLFPTIDEAGPLRYTLGMER